MELQAKAVKEYIESMEDFCLRNFGTSDLDACRTKLEREYEKPWY